MPESRRFIDRLVRAARLDPVKEAVNAADADEVVAWVAPLTNAEREKARREAHSEDPNIYALELLMKKAKDANGNPLPPDSDLDELRRRLAGDLET